jgi:hypothetical protein
MSSVTWSSSSYDSSSNNINQLKNKRLALKILNCSVSVDEGVESDSSSVASSNVFSNDKLASTKSKMTLCLSKSSGKETNKTRSFDDEEKYSSLTTIPLSYQTQAHRSNYHSLKSKRKTNGATNDKHKKIKPFDLTQVKRELRHLIKANRPSRYSSTSTEISVVSNLSRKLLSTYSSSSSVANYNFNSTYQTNKLQSSASMDSDFSRRSGCMMKNLAHKCSKSLCNLFENKLRQKNT